MQGDVECLCPEEATHHLSGCRVMVAHWLDVLPLDHPLSGPDSHRVGVAPSDRQTHGAVQRAVTSHRVEHFLCMWPPSKHVVPHVKLLQPWPSPPDAGFVCMLHFSDNFMPGHFEPVVFLRRTGQDGRMPYHRWPLSCCMALWRPPLSLARLLWAGTFSNPPTKMQLSVTVSMS